MRAALSLIEAFPLNQFLPLLQCTFRELKVRILKFLPPLQGVDLCNKFCWTHLPIFCVFLFAKAARNKTFNEFLEGGGGFGFGLQMYWLNRDVIDACRLWSLQSLSVLNRISQELLAHLASWNQFGSKSIVLCIYRCNSFTAFLVFWRIGEGNLLHGQHVVFRLWSV